MYKFLKKDYFFTYDSHCNLNYFLNYKFNSLWTISYYNIFEFKQIVFVFDLIKKKQGHTFHLVTPSPWPLYGSIYTFFFLLSNVYYMHYFNNSFFYIFFSLFLVLLTMIFWWRDVIREATWQGYHTLIVQKGLRIGFSLFILSEVMFFFGIFWSFFHSSLAPAIQIGSIWPPINLSILDPWKVPFLNTLILLMSGVTITLAHHCIILKTKIANYGFLATIILAICFTACQFYEYLVSTFEISDGIYGTVFYFATGFHGFHVLIGTIFIFVSWIRFILNHFTAKHHIGFECAAWYWHFVDIVWLFLFISIYWWGSI